jgi:hypothetical protein
MKELIDLVKINNTIVLKKTGNTDVLAADFFLYNLVETYHYNGKILIFPDMKIQSTIHVEHFDLQLNNVVKKIKKFLTSKKNKNVKNNFCCAIGV